MNKTLRISFFLKNTYRINCIVYNIRQIPILKKVIPSTLYNARGLKIFANILFALWEIAEAFLGKFLYFLWIVIGTMWMYSDTPREQLFWHIFILLTMIGSFTNTYMFDPTRDKYYALILLRMNAREYALIHYIYAMLKTFFGFLIFGVLFGKLVGLSIWQCLLLPFFVVGAKLTVAAWSLWKYEQSGKMLNENKLNHFWWSLILILLAAAYGLPAIGFMLPVRFCIVVAVVLGLTGLLSINIIRDFPYYREVYQELLAEMFTQMDDPIVTAAREQSDKAISVNRNFTSNRKGFEYLNELFVVRHQKILWQSAKRMTYVIVVLIFGALLVFYLKPEITEKANKILMTSLPYFVFIMYMINRGTGFTRVLFMNCDHSLLTYSFYKKPESILQLFWIRLREIVKVNLMPAMTIGAGLMVLLRASGGTNDPMNYLVLFVSILCLSIFFSVHYLTIYYLLQPYNMGTEMKGGAYQMVMSLTYFFCLSMMGIKIEILKFGILAIGFCVSYCLIASILVYFFAPKRFRLQS